MSDANIDRLESELRDATARVANGMGLRPTSTAIEQGLYLLDDQQLPGAVRQTLTFIEQEFERTAYALNQNAEALRVRADKLDACAAELRNKRVVLARDLREGVSYVAASSHMNAAAIGVNHETAIEPPRS